MQLDEFLTKNSITVSDFAKAIGAGSRATVYRYMKSNPASKRLPNKEMMKRITQVTKGEVTANDFHNSKPSKHKSFKQPLQLPANP